MLIKNLTPVNLHHQAKKLITMADVASAPSPSKAAPKKAKAAGKAKAAKAPAVHPKYIEMAVTALNALKERSGSSRQAIQKYICSNFAVGNDAKVVATHLKMALKRGVDTGAIKHVKGTGASGSFKANPVVKKKEKKPKKPKVAKTTKPKKAKIASPTKAAKSPAKVKSPKKAAKPAKIAKASKSPAKKTVAKKSPAKPKKVAAPKKAAK